jgi:hypothetical protein
MVKVLGTVSICPVHQDTVHRYSSPLADNMQNTPHTEQSGLSVIGIVRELKRIDVRSVHSRGVSHRVTISHIIGITEEG